MFPLTGIPATNPGQLHAPAVVVKIDNVDAARPQEGIGQADVVMLAGARLNWLLSHGRAPLWNPNTKIIQVDISPTEIDSNRAVAAPVVGDIKSVFAAFNAAMKPGRVTRQAAWMDEMAKRKQQNV